MKKNFRYESEYNSEYKQRKQELIEYILDKDYGTTLTYNELAKILKYNIYEELELLRFKGQMNIIKNILIDYGCILKSITGVGYYILKPKQISGYCYHTYIRKTEKLLGKSARILQHTPKSELSEIRKEEYQNVCNLNIDVANAINITVENSEYYSKKRIYDDLKD